MTATTQLRPGHRPAKMRRPQTQRSSQMAVPEHSADPSPNQRVRFELIFGSVLLGIGLFVLPALIYTVGLSLLGPYGEGQGAGLGTFYGDFFGDLAQGEVRTWLLALGPLLLISLIRLIFLGTHPRTAAPTEVEPPIANPRSSEHRSRTEPRIGAD